MKIAIQGHPTRGKDVIQILEGLGGRNIGDYLGTRPNKYYYLDLCSNITATSVRYNFKESEIFTLEEFEKEFPFKIGDKVKHISSIGTIRKYCYMHNKPAYVVESVELGILATIPVKMLEPYKEMKEERNITLTLDKAKEWYNKGGDLKQVALQAFTEKELTKINLPKTWEEFCENYPVQKGECWLECCDSIHERMFDEERRYKNWIRSRKSAEAHLAMIQLEQLRDCWRNGWKSKMHEPAYAIKFSVSGLNVYNFVSREFLSFPTREMAEDFLACFRDLIEKAGDLI